MEHKTIVSADETIIWAAYHLMELDDRPFDKHDSYKWGEVIQTVKDLLMDYVTKHGLSVPIITANVHPIFKQVKEKETPAK